MEFYKKASTANWILKGKIVSKGIYDMEHYIENGEDAVRITKNAYLVFGYV